MSANRFDDQLHSRTAVAHSAEETSGDSSLQSWTTPRLKRLLATDIEATDGALIDGIVFS
jgi:hypothetical protein